jgi:acyl-coenzyme A synthetase/AMP-(fatty) acid ligase
LFSMSRRSIGQMVPLDEQGASPPHPDFGECVVAFVIPNDQNRPPAAADVIQWVKSSLANYKVPKQVVVVDELPRNTMGKVLKNELRTLLVDTSLAPAST